jgi:hypothetical protein
MVRLLALLLNLRPRGIKLSGKNNLAYFAAASATKKKMFYNIDNRRMN